VKPPAGFTKLEWYTAILSGSVVGWALFPLTDALNWVAAMLVSVLVTVWAWR
jgi:hypothetical protein